ncbi:MAG: CvpA family protein [Candidatus Omnitrophota bacterium]
MREFISKLTWVDYVAAVAVIRGCYVGFRSGFFPELLRIAAYLITAAGTLAYYEHLAQFLTLKTVLNYTTARALSFFLLMAGVFFLTKILIMLLLKLLKVGEGGVFYRLLGLGLGACRWVLLLSLLFMMVELSPLTPLKTDVHSRSLVGPKVARVAPALFDFLSSSLSKAGKPAQDLKAA